MRVSPLVLLVESIKGAYSIFGFNFSDIKASKLAEGEVSSWHSRSRAGTCWFLADPYII